MIAMRLSYSFIENFKSEFVWYESRNTGQFIFKISYERLVAFRN